MRNCSARGLERTRVRSLRLNGKSLTWNHARRQRLCRRRCKDRLSKYQPQNGLRFTFTLLLVLSSLSTWSTLSSSSLWVWFLIFMNIFFFLSLSLSFLQIRHHKTKKMQRSKFIRVWVYSCICHKFCTPVLLCNTFFRQTQDDRRRRAQWNGRCCTSKANESLQRMSCIFFLAFPFPSSFLPLILCFFFVLPLLLSFFSLPLICLNKLK